MTAGRAFTPSALYEIIPVSETLNGFRFPKGVDMEKITSRRQFEAAIARWWSRKWMGIVEPKPTYTPHQGERERTRRLEKNKVLETGK